MRLLELMLTRYGPFTDVALDLSGGAEGLHLVYGPNEAGKSSALRAVRGFFFGIPGQTNDNFRHDYKDLLIGARLRGTDGQELEAWRRKGRKDTLRGPGEEVLDEALLTALLGGMEKALFERAFALDYGVLEQGAKELLEGGGGVGESLFEAGMGTQGLRKLRRALEDEAQAIFRPRGSTQELAKAEKAWKEAVKLQRDEAMSGKAWEAAREALAAAEARREVLDAQHAEARREEARLQRLRSAAPKLARRVELLGRLDELRGVPGLPADFAARRRAAQEARRAAEGRAGTAEEQVARREEALAGLEERPELLARKERIGDLRDRRGEQREAARQRRLKAAEAREHRAEAEAALRRAWPGRTVEALRAEPVGAADEQRVRSLVARWRELAPRKGLAERAAEEARAELKAAQEALDGAAAPEPGGPLELAVARSRKAGDVDAAVASARRAEASAARKVAEARGRLRGWEGDAEDAPGLAVPAEALVRTLRDGARVLEERGAEADREAARLAGERADLEAQRAELRAQGEVPTEAQLEAVREERGATWGQVRAAWLQGAPVEAPWASGEGLADGYEAQVEGADDVSDALRKEAQRVERDAALRASVEALVAREARLAAERAAVAEARAAWETGWREAWAPAGVEPEGPEAMEAWLRHLEALRERVEALHGAREVCEAAEAAAQRVRADLVAVLAGDGPGAEAGVAAWLDEAEAQVTARAAARARYEGALAERDRCKVGVEKAERGVREVAADVEAWDAEWEAATASLREAGARTPEEAEAVLDALAQATAALAAADKRAQEVAKGEADAEAFEAEVRALLGEVGRAGDVPVDAALDELGAALQAAERAAEERGRLTREAAEWAEKLEEDRDEGRRQAARLAGLCEEAGVADEEALPGVEEQAAAKRQAREALEAVEEELRELAAGRTVEALAEEAAAVDQDALPEQLQRLEERLAELDEERAAANRESGERSQAFASMEGTEKAAEAAEAREAAAATIQRLAREYAVLHLGSRLIARATERYREKHQGPLLEKASGLFRHLTRGSLDGLVTDFDDKDQQVLLGLRPDGKRLGIDGMSDGTCEQLYLALRLAALHRHLDAHDPVPFIVDDILIHSDAERSAAILEALAELSDRTQVLLFTHHAHVVELARASVSPARLFVQELPGPADQPS